jgi:hypothetical protein
MHGYRNASVPRWLAPVIAPIVCASFSLRIASEASRTQGGQFDPTPPAMIAAAVGMVIGLLILLADRPRGNRANSPAHGRESTLVGRTLCLAALLVCWVPLLGIVPALVAAGLNVRTTEWPRRASWIGLGVAVVSLLVFLFWPR